MSKSRRRDKERASGVLRLTGGALDTEPDRPRRVKVVPLEAQTEAQGHYIIGIEGNVLTFGVGPAGTGKTYVCGALAAEALHEGKTRKLIVTRPAVEAGESLGFLPGELHEKYEPYFRPFQDVLEERLGAGTVEYMVKAKRIEAMPLAFMRGMTFKNAWVILDEAQNTTPTQMKLFLTRIGHNAKVIVNGDLSQKDITGPSGLEDAIDRLHGLGGVNVVHFDRSDIVRSGIVQEIVERYRV